MAALKSIRVGIRIVFRSILKRKKTSKIYSRKTNLAWKRISSRPIRIDSFHGTCQSFPQMSETSTEAVQKRSHALVRSLGKVPNLFNAATKGRNMTFRLAPPEEDGARRLVGCDLGQVKGDTLALNASGQCNAQWVLVLDIFGQNFKIFFCRFLCF